MSDSERDAIIAEFATGKSCRQIAQQFGRSTTTISTIAKAVGHEFGQVNTTRAREIKSHYDEERRARLKLKHVESVERMFDQLFAPAKMMKIGGKDNVYTEHVIDEPTFQDKRDITQAISNLMRSVLEMDKRETGSEDQGLFDRVFARIDAEADEYSDGAGH